MDIKKYEETKLTETLKKIKEILEFEENRYDNLPNLYKHDPNLLATIMSMVSIKINNLSKNIKKPYFARIDFTEDGKSLEKLYIGKTGVIDNDNNILIVDWRAPVSTVYYDSNLGEVEYKAPEKIINRKSFFKKTNNY